MSHLWLVIGFILLLVFLSFASQRGRRRKIILFGNSLVIDSAERDGYIALLEDMLDKASTSRYQLINLLTTENGDFDRNLEKNVLTQHPYMVVVLVGTGPKSRNIGVESSCENSDFEEAYRSIISRIMQTGAKIILCTTPVFNETKEEGELPGGEAYRSSAVIRQVGSDLHLPVIDVVNTFEQYRKKGNGGDSKSHMSSEMIDWKKKNNSIAELLFAAIQGYE